MLNKDIVLHLEITVKSIHLRHSPAYISELGFNSAVPQGDTLCHPLSLQTN